MIELLVDRLRWPASLVRERAATRLSERLVDGDDETREALLSWIADQELESLAAIGLLPFLHAAGEADVSLPQTADLASACKARSVLSELYLSHLDAQYVSRPDLGRHSGSPPDSWRPSENAGTSDTRFEDGLREGLRMIGQRSQVPIERQFDFELAALRGRHRESPASAGWAAGNYDSGHNRGWRPVSTEVSTSAYLRTLAWAARHPGVPNNWILGVAARVSPVDLGLWGVRSTTSPDWWPRLDPTDSASEVDREVATVLRKLHAAEQSWQSDGSVLLAAGGCVSQTNLRQHDIEIRAFFQRTYGPSRPPSEELFEYLKSARSVVRQEPSPLRFAGPLIADEEPRRLADWVVLPCSGATDPLAVILWQGWRGVRGIHCPSRELADGDIRAICRPDSVDYQCGGELVARWSDWSENLSAFGIRDLPHANGWTLVAPQSIVDRIARETGMTLAWSWELTSHFRDYAHGEFTVHRMHEDYGTTRLVRP